MIKVTCLADGLGTLKLRRNKLRTPDNLTKQTVHTINHMLFTKPRTINKSHKTHKGKDHKRKANQTTKSKKIIHSQK